MTRRLTWLIQFAVLTLFAWVAAGIISTISGYLIYSIPTPGEYSAQGEIPKKEKMKGREAYNVIMERDLLKVARTGIPTGPGSVDPSADRPIAEMGLKLKGTIAGPEEIARAIIDNKNEQRLYRIGDEILGAKLIAIFRNKVIMNVNGQEQMLVIEEAEPRGRAQAGAAARTPGALAPTAGVPGGTAMMKDLNEYLGKARVIPFFRGGEPYGFRISNLGRDAEAYQLGVRSGDIIRSINGVPVRTPDDAFKAYQQFQNESNLQLEVERGRETLTVNIPVKK
jgi:general secretion pathway protein C